MAPGRGAKRSYRSAPGRLRVVNCNSNTKRFEICPSESLSVSCLFVFLLACVVLLSHCASGQSLSARENIDCTYANSTCSSSTCGNLCLQGEFYPLFPSRCHPSYTVSACGKMFVRCQTTIILCTEHYTLLIKQTNIRVHMSLFRTMSMVPAVPTDSVYVTKPRGQHSFSLSCPKGFCK